MRPNLVIAGVNKAGTTSLFGYLADHPEICASSIKETCYFLPIRYGEPMAPVGDYEKLFSHYAGEKVVMEATPGYFYGGRELVETLKSALPESRVVIILRDPVARLVSFFNFMKSMLNLEQDMSFEEYVERCRKINPEGLKKRENNCYFGVEGGNYHKYLPDWISAYGENLKILFFEDMKKDPRSVVQELSEWLGVNPDFYNQYEFGVANQTTQFNNRWLHGKAIAINKQFETFFRSIPQLKAALKKIYAKMNLSTTKTKSSINDGADNPKFSTLYLESNLELTQILRDAGIRRLPDWLR